jgi:hypothetical protein
MYVSFYLLRGCGTDHVVERARCAQNADQINIGPTHFEKELRPTEVVSRDDM